MQGRGRLAGKSPHQGRRRHWQSPGDPWAGQGFWHDEIARSAAVGTPSAVPTAAGDPPVNLGVSGVRNKA